MYMYMYMKKGVHRANQANGGQPTCIYMWQVVIFAYKLARCVVDEYTCIYSTCKSRLPQSMQLGTDEGQQLKQLPSAICQVHSPHIISVTYCQLHIHTIEVHLCAIMRL